MNTVPLPRKRLEDLRSQRWFTSDDIRGFAHRQRMQQQGLAREEFMGRPVIAIINTWSDLSPCHAHFPQQVEAIKRGVLQAGGYPMELPALSLGEVMVKPTTMLYRNLLAIETEELLRSLPVDGAILLGGCDKTPPALVMGALSMDLPALFVPAGPMLNDRHRGQAVGAGTHTKKFFAEYSIGQITQPEWVALEARMTRSAGTCNTMGTASTMTAIVEALGLSLPGAMSIPAVDAEHTRMAWRSGQRIVEMVWEDLRPRRIATRAAFLNAVAATMALGGSTNAAVHLPAMAGRAGVTLTLDDLDAVARRIPVIANLYPSGQHLMEDFHYAGGLPVVLQRIAAHLDLSALTATGRSLGENLAACAQPVGENEPQGEAGADGSASPSGSAPANGTPPRPAILTLDHPLRPPQPDCPDASLALAVLRGNLCPDGAVIKPSAASPELLQHEGPALVFDDNAQMLAAMADETLEVDANTVLVLRNGGPVGGPGMPEWGNLPIPKKLLRQGVRDMLRISDARMSGTHYGSCVLHVSPESAVGGPLALLKTGDRIRLDVAQRRLDMLVDDAELARRRAEWMPPPQPHLRGYTKIFLNEVTQAHLGCDFASLSGTAPTPEPPIY